MKLTVDTNILVRLAIQDNLNQLEIATQILDEAELIAVPLIVLCEFVWVLRKGYKLPNAEVANTIRLLLKSENVKFDQAGAAAGLAILDAGGDFADGVIAHEGTWLGGEVFASFDKEAVALLKAQGQTVKLL